MADESQYRFLKRRTRSTFLTALFSISLVLFFLALFGGSALFTRNYLRKVQEEFEVMLMLSDEIAEGREMELQNAIAGQGFAKDIQFISRDQAAKEFMNSVGQDFLEIMDGINPIRASLNVRLKASYLESDSLKHALAFFNSLEGVAEVISPDKEIAGIRSNSKTMLQLSLGMGLIVIVIAWFLIGSTIRLAIFSRRFAIRTMQLIGATNGFIRRPFIGMGVLQGLTGGLLASAGFLGLLQVLIRYYPDYKDIALNIPIAETLIMLAGITIFGTLLGWLISSFAVNRFLNRPVDQLV